MFVRFNAPKTYDTMMENFFTSDTMPNCCADPAMDIVEQENEIVVNAELPGMKKEDVKITFEKNVLTISGERKSAELPEKAKVLLNESRSRAFDRSVRFGFEIDAEKISAEMNNGILTITMPKTDEVKAKEIPIN
jgi:HSP20 family protein